MIIQKFLNDREHASMEEIFLEKKRPLHDIKNTQHVNVKDANKCNDKCTDNDGEFSLAENSNSSSDYVADALSRRKRKAMGN